MILLHETETPHYLPVLGLQKGHPVWHAISSLPGANGAIELLQMARKIGAHDCWIQDAGSYREHFDLFKNSVEIALALGAVRATTSEIGAVLKLKKGQYPDENAIISSVTSSQMKSIIYSASQRAPSFFTLCETAAQNILNFFLCRNGAFQSAAILCGPGGTGLVGIALARAAAKKSLPADIYLINRNHTLTENEHSIIQNLEQSGAHIFTHIPAKNELARYQYLFDALLGNGSVSEPYGAVASAIFALQQYPQNTIAIDLPSGMDPDERGVYDLCVCAAETYIITLPRRCHTHTFSEQYTGKPLMVMSGADKKAIKSVSAGIGANVPLQGYFALLRRQLAEAQDFSSEWTRFIADLR